ncbi:class F sortase [Kineosporia mesophila]|uniref:Class F sortase n=1 Tax=Kineosporia mesophila TaxID=566012 RepID=A0ABP6Z5U0_9ACTN
MPSLASPAPVPAADRPTRIAIPSIGVDSSLLDLGLQKDGTLEVPGDPQRAGWFDRSAAPGRQGPAIIAGHIDSKSGPAVFYRLAALKAGARITVTTAGGKKVTFTVDGVQQYRKAEFPTAAVYGPVPGPVLRLITCGGPFDRDGGHYRDNVVVYAS